jgi:hypothetical protein
MRSRDEIKEFLRNMPQKAGLVDRAIIFARFAHDGQTDRGNRPYFEHPARVASRTEDAYGDELLTAAAYLHDTVEDGGLAISDLKMFFPDVVWKTVAALTRAKTTPREEYIENISRNYIAAKVKVCDLEDNIDLGHIPRPTAKDYERRDRYLAEYRKLKDAIADWERRLPPKELETAFYAECYC